MSRLKSTSSGQRITECQRCGTCCRKGGPTLHIEDKPLVERGLIPLKNLFTIRKGEWVRENVRGELIATDMELIRLKGTTHSWTCLYFDEDTSECRIYSERPIECRAMKCWDTRDIIMIYQKNRLSRHDLLGGVEGLWDLVTDHESRCGHDRISKLANQMRQQSNKEIEGQLSQILSYDREIRRLLVGQGVDASMNDLFLGRPLSKTIEMFGIRVTETSGRLIASPCPTPVKWSGKQ